MLNCFQGALPLRILFGPQQGLGTGRDVGQRIVDLVARAVGEFLHGVELGLLKLGLLRRGQRPFHRRRRD